MKYLGLDLGARSLGMAISDKTLTVATFYKNIKCEENSDDYLIEEIKQVVEKENISKIILGFPKNMNNTLGERAQKTIEFKEKIESALFLEVILEDERLSTKVAEQALIKADIKRNKRKTKIDGVSACVILQSYLDKGEKQ